MCCKDRDLFFTLQIFLQLFQKYFLRLFFAFVRLCIHAHEYARAHAYTYIKHYVLRVFAPGSAQTASSAKKRLFVRLQFLRKYFSKIICLYGRKVITLHADTGNDLTQLKRTPRTVSTRMDTTGTKCALCSLFEFLDKLLTSVKK